MIRKSGRSGSVKWVKGVLIYIVLIIAAIFFLLPIFFMVSTSFKIPSEFRTLEPVFLPTEPTLMNYDALINPDKYTSFDLGSSLAWPMESMIPYFVNTVIISFITAAICLLLGAAGAYGIERFGAGWGPRGSGLKSWILSIRFLPPIAFIVPLYQLFRTLGLVNTRWAVIWLNVVFNVPLTLWLMASFYKEIPKDIDEAAQVDGWGRLTTFFRIIWPLTLPGLTVSFLFALFFTWNEFLAGFTMTFSADAMTFPVFLSTFRGHKGTVFGIMSALTMVGMIPMLITFFLVRKYLTRGLTLGEIRKL